MKKIYIVITAIFMLAGCASLTENLYLGKKTKEEMKELRQMEEEKRLLNDIEKVAFIPLQAGVPDNTITSPDKILIFTDKPNKKFIEVGILELQLNSNYEYLTKLLKLKGSQIGADALIKFEMGEVPVGTVKRGGITIGAGNSPVDYGDKTIYHKRVKGIAVKFIK